MDKIGAAVWATGRAGRVIVEAGLTRPWLEFRGGIVYSPAKEGLDLGEACGLDVRARCAGLDGRRRRPGPARHRRRVLLRASGRRPRSPPRACGRTARGRTPSRSPGSSIRRRSWARRPPPSWMPRSRAAGQRILGTGFWDYLTITLPLASISNVLTFDEIRLERVADTSLWGHGILRDEGIGGPRRGRRRRVHDAQLPGRGADAARPSRAGLEHRRAGLRERARSCRRSGASGPGYVVEPGTICGHDRQVTRERPRRRPAGVAVARPVRPQPGSRRHGGLGAGRRRGRPAPSRPSSAATSSSTPTRRPAPGRWPRSGRCGRWRPACTRSTSWASGRSSARAGTRSAYPAISRSRSVSPRSASAATNAARIERALGRVDARRGPPRDDQVGGDGRDRPGDGRRRGPPDLLDREVVDERHRPAVADPRRRGPA